MAILLDDQRAAQSILEHIENRTTDLGDTVWREPVVNYRSKVRLGEELERVFKSTPTPF